MRNANPNKANALYAILFEAIALAIHMDTDRQLLNTCVAVLGKFLMTKVRGAACEHAVISAVGCGPSRTRGTRPARSRAAASDVAGVLHRLFLEDLHPLFRGCASTGSSPLNRTLPLLVRKACRALAYEKRQRPVQWRPLAGFFLAT